MTVAEKVTAWFMEDKTILTDQEQISRIKKLLDENPKAQDGPECEHCFQQVKKLPVVKKENNNQLDYAGFLFQLAYCRSCAKAVHFTCHGKDASYKIIKAEKEKDSLLTFECNDCALGEGIEPDCFYCHQSEGLRRQVGSKYFHQICAMANGLRLKDVEEMRFVEP